MPSSGSSKPKATVLVSTKQVELRLIPESVYFLNSEREPCWSDPKKKKRLEKKTKMSSGHRTAVVVHSPPLSARAIKAVCDCTLGAVNVKAVAGRKKKKGKKEETLQVRSGQEWRNRASSQEQRIARPQLQQEAAWRDGARRVGITLVVC